MSASRKRVLLASGGLKLPHTCQLRPEDELLGEACPRLASCLQELHPGAPCALVRFVLKADGSSGLPFATENFQDVQGVAFDDVREDTAPLFALLDPEDLDRVLVSMTQAARSLTPWFQEYIIMPPQGGARWLRSCLVPQQDDLGQVVGYGLITDITAEKKMREELLVLCEQGAIGVFRSTAEGHYLDVNQHFAHICGYDSPEEFLQNVDSLADQCCVQPEEHATVLRLLQNHGAIERYALELRSKGGSTVWISLNVRAVRDVQGRVECCEGYCADISEQVLQEMRAGHCLALTRARFGQAPGSCLSASANRALAAQKPAGCAPDGLCHVLSYVRDTILCRMRLPKIF